MIYLLDKFNKMDSIISSDKSISELASDLEEFKRFSDILTLEVNSLELEIKQKHLLINDL